MTDLSTNDVLRTWLARYDANDKAAARGRPFMWDDDGNVTATSHNFDNVIPPMDVDEVEAVRAVLADNARLRALVADELSRLGQELEQGGGALWDCPDSPSRGQRAHHFGNPKEQWTECLNGCGMTWARLQEASS